MRGNGEAALHAGHQGAEVLGNASGRAGPAHRAQRERAGRLLQAEPSLSAAGSGHLRAAAAKLVWS